jgi:WD40 repeat protein
VLLSNDARAVIVVDDKGAITWHDASSGKQLRPPIVMKQVVAGMPVPFLHSALSPNAQWVALTDGVNLKLFDVSSGAKLHEWPRANGQTFSFSLAFSPDGTLLAEGRGDSNRLGEIVLRDVKTGQTKATLPGSRDYVDALAFSPDGKQLAGGGKDGTMKIWDPSSAEELRTFSVGKAGVSALAFSRDGRRLAVAAGPEVSLVDAATGKEQQRLRAYSHLVTRLCFSPDGERLATAGGADKDSGKGGGIKLWDLVSGQEVLSLGGTTDVVQHIVFSPDGRRLYTSRMQGLFLGAAFGQQSSELLIWQADAAEDRNELPNGKSEAR